VNPITTLILTAGTLVAPLVSADDWTLRRHDEEHDIVVYERTTTEGYREFRGVTHVRGRLSALVALLGDEERMPDWIYRTSEVRTLEELSDTENFTYIVNKMPWPFRDRDSVVRAELAQDPLTQVVTVRANSAPDYHPTHKRYIRMPVVGSTWLFAPLPDGRTRIEFRGYADPGGRLSSGLLKKFQAMLVWHAPHQTLLRMRELIPDPKYQSANYRFIQEPTIWTARE